MSNKITSYLSKQIGKPVTNAMLLNTIRESASENYKKDVPEFQVSQSLNHANNGVYAQFELHANEFLNILINRIGTTVAKALSFENPLGIFRSENFEYGETIQEIFADLADGEDFNAKGNDNPFRYKDTSVHVFYHDINREKKYMRTFDKTWVQKAFASENSFDEFIDKMFVSLLSSDAVDEFEKVKNLIPQALRPVKIDELGATITNPSMEFDTSKDNFLIEFNKELISRSNLMAVPSRTRFENGAKVPNATPIEEQFLLVDAKFSAELDTMLANAFNMDKATVLAKKIVLDTFPAYEGEGELNGARPFAALISKNSIIMKDKLFQMTNLWNPENLNYNYWLHHHETISWSLLENSMIYYTM